MVHLLLLRHGQTASNADGRLQGHLPTPLNALGLDQARRLAMRLVGYQPSIGSLVSSDLRRALETASPIAEALGLPVQQDSAWRERAFGSLEGKQVGEVEVWRAATGTLDPPGAESIADMSARVSAALTALVQRRASGSCTGVVTHGGVMRMALALFADGRLPLQPGEIRPEVGPVLNASILHLTCDATRWAVVRVNDVDHLTDAGQTSADAG